MTSNRKLLGHVRVEGGKLLMIDPVHLDQWESGEFDEDASTYPTYGYDEASQLALAGKEHGTIFRNFAVLTRAPQGEIPVYGLFDEQGKLLRIEMELVKE
ncbi:hypothetical protein [Ammoniphilus sp. YIM 78166]|uniref:hypothetical protein n=1 Tax=Ammoniphilus sp. YIM 78166 TaxID=1644106 RepID=UPI00106F7604|nr:hypothetical protein [Ammoniphilus sp. YIM 78166]